MDREGWQGVIVLEDLTERHATQASFEGEPVLVYREGDRIWAIGNRCTHQGAPLNRGIVRIGGSRSTATCPAHGSMFNLEDGTVVKGPAREPVPAFEARLVDGMVELRPR